MGKLILILAIILSAASCIASETVNLNFGSDYLVTTEKTINTSNVNNHEILTLSPFFTIFNEKNVFLLHPLKVGKTNITFFIGNTAVSFDIVIKQKGLNKSADNIKKGNFEFLLLDSPPVIDDVEESRDKYLDLDPPPTRNGGK